MAKHAFVIETEPRLRDVRMLQRHLYEFNAEETGFRDGEWLAIFLRGDSDSIVAGLYGWT